MYLSPAPLYHSAPQGGGEPDHSHGRHGRDHGAFDPEQYLKLVEKYRPTHSQLVPTMFSRMLKLPAEVREKYDVSSLEVAIHAAAPCPPQVKEQMIEWWGPVLLEYYSATELLGWSVCDSHEWLSHRGTVGKVVSGDISVLDEDMRPVPRANRARCGSRP